MAVCRIIGKTGSEEYISYIFPDGEGTLELTAKIDRLEPKGKMDSVKRDFQVVVNSLTIEPCQKA